MPDRGAGAMMPSQRAPSVPPFSSETAPRLALGFDFGTRRIGVAVGGEMSGAARPLAVVPAGAGQWERIAALVAEWGPDLLVVGIARHPDGAAHAMTARCEKFARSLHGRTGLAVERVDERYSSAEAGGAQARDDEAAAVILQQWLDERVRAGDR
jgi:putative holliday junction resolvase